MRRPNFFIAGAPKSGTTALYIFLRDHPAIFLPALKEPHFWCDDFPRIQKISSLQDYLDLYSDMRPEHVCAGEASVSYMASEVALAKIAAFNPKSKIVLVLRNPVDMVYAFHSELLWNGNEDVQDFGRAWDLQETRRAGRHIPATCREPKFLQYRCCASYGAQFDRILSIFPREQTRIFLFDDFCDSPRTVYQDTLEFLGVQDNGRNQFPSINENKVARSPLVSRILRQPSPLMSKIADRTKRILRLKQIGISRLHRKLNSRVVERTPLRADMRERLAAEFRTDLERLEILIGRDLHMWYMPGRQRSVSPPNHPAAPGIR